MKFSQVFAVATLAAGAMAAPKETPANLARAAIQKRAPALTDADILNFALTLEHLEATFYREAVHNYTAAMFTAAGYPAPFYENVVRLSLQEATHVNALTAALKAAGSPAVAECTYAFPSNSVASFAAVAQILEGVGISAYSGAAAAITEDAYLTTAATILSVEARHSSYLRNANKVVPYPSVFDIPLTPRQVFTLAAPFIVKCPSGSNLPFTAYPSLSLSPSQKMPIAVGDTIDLVTKVAPKTAPKFACWPLVSGAVCGAVTKKSATTYSTVVPKGGVTGQGYVLLTSANSLSDADTIAGPAIVESLPPTLV